MGDLRITKVDHVGVVVDDLAEACRLLGHSFGLQESGRIERSDLRAVFLACGDTDIELIEVLDPDARAERLGSRTALVEHIAFSVDDLDVTLEALEALGIRLKAQTTRSLNVRTAFTEPTTSGGVVFQFVESRSARK